MNQSVVQGLRVTSVLSDERPAWAQTLAFGRGRTKRDTGAPNGLLNELNF
jgi:hypothetical protein